MKKIFATNDKVKYAIVDDDVFEIIKNMGLKFCIKKDGYWYLTKRIQLPGMTEKKSLLLHRFIWILKTGELPIRSVDHIDINKSNNQFSNLRLATRKQQSQHQGKQKNNTSGFVGVSFLHDKRGNGYDYWRARIHNPNGKNETKSFPCTETGKIAAAKYYDSKAKEYFGEFHGQLNFPEDTKN